MRDLVFYFNFSDDNEKEYLYAFIVKQLDINSNDLLDEDWFDEAFHNLEDIYGVHDWSSAPDPKVVAVGYCSYEVEPSKHLELMNKWKEAFSSQYPLLKVTEVVKLKPSSEYNDYDVYKKALSKLKNTKG